MDHLRTQSIVSYESERSLWITQSVFFSHLSDWVIIHNVKGVTNLEAKNGSGSHFLSIFGAEAATFIY